MCVHVNTDFLSNAEYCFDRAKTLPAQLELNHAVDCLQCRDVFCHTEGRMQA
jgi:hypothetical protein